jgi:hypothetical protein
MSLVGCWGRCSLLGTLLNNLYCLQKVQTGMLLVHVDVDQGGNLQDTNYICGSEEDGRHSVSRWQKNKWKTKLIAHITRVEINSSLNMTSSGPGSVVSIATGYGLDGPGIEEIFRTCPDRPWDPPSLLYNECWVFPGGKERPGRDADPSPSSSAVVMKE